jgi:hypothetical protein
VPECRHGRIVAVAVFWSGSSRPSGAVRVASRRTAQVRRLRTSACASLGAPVARTRAAPPCSIPRPTGPRFNRYGIAVSLVGGTALRCDRRDCRCHPLPHRAPHPRLSTLDGYEPVCHPLPSECRRPGNSVRPRRSGVWARSSDAHLMRVQANLGRTRAIQARMQRDHPRMTWNSPLASGGRRSWRTGRTGPQRCVAQPLDDRGTSSASTIRSLPDRRDATA